MSDASLKNIVEAALLASGRPLSLDALLSLFLDEAQPDQEALREALKTLAEDYEGRGIEVVEVSTGWRIQVRSRYAPWVSRLWEEKPQRYSRALMETLALIAYRQPITRGDVEEIRGVAVSTNIIKTLLEREWVRVVGHRDVPGKPALYATTRAFLDYFGLKTLDDLPTLSEIRDLESLNQELNFGDSGETPTSEEGDAPESPPEAGEPEAEELPAEKLDEALEISDSVAAEAETTGADEQAEQPGDSDATPDEGDGQVTETTQVPANDTD